MASASRTLSTAVQGLAAVSAQYRAVQQATAERLAAGLYARQASAPAEMLQSMIQAGAEDDPDVQAWHLMLSRHPRDMLCAAHLLIISMHVLAQERVHEPGHGSYLSGRRL